MLVCVWCWYIHKMCVYCLFVLAVLSTGQIPYRHLSNLDVEGHVQWYQAGEARWLQP